MNPNPLPVTEADLQGYVDGLLPQERLADVAAWLEHHPEEAERLRTYRHQNQALHLLFDPVLDEPLPARLAARPSSNWELLRRYAAVFIVAIFAGAGGWYLHGAAQSSPVGWIAAVAGNATRVDAPLMMARRAAVAHAVYTPDPRRPVEVGADQEEALVRWLSKRIGADVRAPKLAPLGYELIGGRLLPGQSAPVAQFMYHDGAGRRLTLYVSTDQVQNKDTGFRFAQEGTVNVFYWIDGKFGYALSGSIDRAELARIANSVYEQLDKPAR
ncbi:MULTISPECIES: anti-sigma factor [unclassified Herbaspirillum]|uniref:anti-sigma factor family protein n=1 Tax=unclassified Herbaspirillum TaxID=2624150 RepID=UPI000E2F0815|nr:MULTISPECIES: anti-sigma factor [unclassified Herbaspirillum]RFB73349.1 anti-sigma factor [Herbaspirillum sp. 3R-3a1]TFI10846.1 anti-sigma factor [Herbaspirillum sp. 3R11]TFI16754.1 anti-sigma factor [Herbaspirillum sp. 3R-11]TFI29316.1 anti-sigma factor [Herbaspirillum sp. 3C11]